MSGLVYERTTRVTGLWGGGITTIGGTGSTPCGITAIGTGIHRLNG